MRTILCTLLSVVLIGWLPSRIFAAGNTRERLLMDFGWRFHLGDAPDAGSKFDYPEFRSLGKGRPTDAEDEARMAPQRIDAAKANLGSDVSFVKPDFNDSDWRKLDLPHDWAVELPFDKNTDKSHGYKAMGPKVGNDIGWYRRTFTIPADDKGRSMWLEFDGVYRNSLVWVNGTCLGRHPSGYTSFSYDISKLLKPGQENSLVVRVDASHVEGWWYEGAGIYRHVWLAKTPPVHVAHWGTYVTSQLNGNNAKVTIETTIRNDADKPKTAKLVSSIVDADGKEVAKLAQDGVQLDSGSEQVVKQTIELPGAKLWSIEQPYLYKIVSQVDQSDSNDQVTTNFGIRTIKFDPNEGFLLNGKRVELKGVCNHQDHAGVGVAVPDALFAFRLKKLKEMGVNAYRMSHNPPAPEVLDLCDRMGILVMDENRRLGFTDEFMGALQSMILRDRNHPSIIIWSIGNEEGALQGSDQWTQAFAVPMQDLVHKLDPTRPVTVAMNGAWGTGFSKVIDVQGFNYFRLGMRRGRMSIDEFHKQFPDKPCVGTEEASTVSTRGIYANDKEKGYVSAYDLNKPGWGATAEDWWNYYVQRPFLAGAFVWTGFDYRGEPTPYSWPCINSHFGIMDMCGFPKDNFYYYQAWWTDKPVLHVLPHWNWEGKEGQDIDVWVHSNYDAVELLLNGKSLGKKDVPRNVHVEWKVPYEKGVLEARGFKGNQVVETQKVPTTSAPARLVLAPDRSQINADGQDVSVITVSTVDADGNPVPTAENLVKFEIVSSGDPKSAPKIIGVGNGDPSCHEPDKAQQRSLFNGLAQVIVQSAKAPGSFKLIAHADGLTDASTELTAQPCQPRPEAPQ